MGWMGAAMSTAAGLLAAIAFGWGVGVVALFRFRRCAFLAPLSEQAVLEILDLGFIENILLPFLL